MPGATPTDDPLAGDIGRLAAVLHPDAVQLFYSVAVHSRSELSLAPDEHAGFIMACLRMLALNGQAGPQTALQAPVPATQTAAPTAGAAVATPAGASRSPVVAERGIPEPAAAITKQAVVATATPPSTTEPSASAASVTTETASEEISQPSPAEVSESSAASVPHTASAPAAASLATTTSASATDASSIDVVPSPDIVAAQDVPPWEDLPGTTASSLTSDPKITHTAALAVTPSVAHTQTATAPPRADEPPAWVDEDIPDEAESGYVPDSEFTVDPDDEFETLATAAPVADLAPMPRRQSAPPRRARQSGASLNSMSATEWPALAAKLPVTGLAAELARQSEWSGVQGDAVVLRVAVKTLAESESRIRLQTVLCEHFGQGLRLEIEVGATGDGTAHAVAQIEKAARQQAAEDAVASDPFVLALKADFGGRVSAVRAVEPTA